MLNDLVKNIITVDIDDAMDYSFPLNESFGLKIINDNVEYNFILKLSDSGENLIIFCDEDNNYLKTAEGLLNESDEILKQECDKLSKTVSSQELKINNLNDMIITKDSALISLTNKIEELTEINKDNEILSDEIKTKKEQIEELIASINDRDLKINELITDYNNAAFRFKTDMKKAKYENANYLETTINEKDKQIESMSKQIELLESAIANNNDNLNSLYDEIDLLKSIIAEKDKTIESFKGGK